MPKKRTTNRDHAKRHQRPMMEDREIAAQLAELVTPALIAQEKSYRGLGMRDRILNLPLMVAAVLTLIWRDVAGVTELTRILAREGFLWCEPKQVSQQALSQRFLTFPAEIFERVFKELLPEFERKWHSRKQRPLPESIQFARTKFERIWTMDGSTLEAVFRKLDSLATVPKNKLGGKIGVVVDLVTRLPVEIWFQENAKASDMGFETDMLNLVKPQTLMVLDRGFCHYQFWQQLIERNVHLITRLNNKASFTVESAFTNSYSIRDRISLEMIYRGLYHFYVAHHQGLASDPIKYFAAPENRDLGVVKSIRKPFKKLIIDPFPERVSREGSFFFEPSPQPCLTTALAP